MKQEQHVLTVGTGSVRGLDLCSKKVWRPAERYRDREEGERDTKQQGLDPLIIPLRRRGGGVKMVVEKCN